MLELHACIKQCKK